jgi:hypothetical protein
MYNKNKFHKKPKPIIIEIKTNRFGWYEVELVKIINGRWLLLKLPSGELLRRKCIRVRWGKTKHITRSK